MLQSIKGIVQPAVLENINTAFQAYLNVMGQLTFPNSSKIIFRSELLRNSQKPARPLLGQQNLKEYLERYDDNKGTQYIR